MYLSANAVCSSPRSYTNDTNSCPVPLYYVGALLEENNVTNSIEVDILPHLNVGVILRTYKLIITIYY